MTLIENNLDQKQAFSRIVKIALVLNFAMFFVEFFCGIIANSMSLITDSFDFFGDSVNYLIAIYVLKKSQKFQSFSAVIKACFMLVFGLFVSVLAFKRALLQIPIPSSNMMIFISSLALFVNLFVSFLLYKFRHGSSNQKSVWLCSRNDAINNFMVVIAGFLVSYFSSNLPDLIAAAIMAILAISSSFVIFRAAFFEFKKNKL